MILQCFREVSFAGDGFCGLFPSVALNMAITLPSLVRAWSTDGVLKVLFILVRSSTPWCWCQFFFLKDMVRVESVVLINDLVQLNHVLSLSCTEGMASSGI